MAKAAELVVKAQVLPVDAFGVAADAGWNVGFGSTPAVRNRRERVSSTPANRQSADSIGGLFGAKSRHSDHGRRTAHFRPISAARFDRRQRRVMPRPDPRIPLASAFLPSGSLRRRS